MTYTLEPNIGFRGYGVRCDKCLFKLVGAWDESAAHREGKRHASYCEVDGNGRITKAAYDRMQADLLERKRRSSR